MCAAVANLTLWCVHILSQFESVPAGTLSRAQTRANTSVTLADFGNGGHAIEKEGGTHTL